MFSVGMTNIYSTQWFKKYIKYQCTVNLFHFK